MKRLTPRYKRWSLHRQHYVSRRRRAAASRLSHFISTRTMVRLYESVQKLARQLASIDSFGVIWAYCQYLQTPDFQFPDYIEVAPQFLAAPEPRTMLSEWTLEQITREVIQYADKEPRANKGLQQWATLAQIANTLRDLEGEIYAQLVGGKKIHLELMQNLASPIYLAAAAPQIRRDHPLLQTIQYASHYRSIAARARADHRSYIFDWHVIYRNVSAAPTRGGKDQGRGTGSHRTTR